MGIQVCYFTFTYLSMKKKLSLIVFVLFKNNNILISVTHLNGNIFQVYSTGKLKKKTLRKTTLTSIKTTLTSIKTTFHFFMFHFKIKGIHKYKRFTIRLLCKIFSESFLSLTDLTCVPHNGCKTQKIKRL